MDNKKTGKFISELRKEKELTQKELADKLFVTDRAVSKWERGMGYPDITIIIELSKILGVSINEILYGERLEQNEEKEIIKDSVKFYTKLQKQSILKKCLILIPLVLVIFYLGIMTFTEVNNGCFPFTKCNVQMDDWASFSKISNKQNSKKLLDALVNSDFNSLEELIMPSDAKSNFKYVEDFEKLKEKGVKFAKYNYKTGYWGEYGFCGYYEISVEYNRQTTSINLGIIKVGKRLMFGGITYNLGQTTTNDNEKSTSMDSFDSNILNEVVKAFSIDYEEFINNL